ncbi:hypothetical protein [Burkholderia pseudomallei]|uniref:Uncharacterized protein n=2 Tax=Burkholderia pseudomallei TaxID=28450 RepID=A0AA40MEL0_BURPE|nr:hypothetical protein [Burkholderia pseudomallei]KGC42570.1 hypothetical protein DO65_374 [Burkholderia pseudomallei]KGD36285.1 hypothetical protein DP44_1274 [Burkholderia pseudomallei]KGD39188.1 hypothetical protein DO72_3756 [Burkholderia pseudomallei]KGS39095.1 hypothetical protein X961_5835 [Burkholderia pseudomallei MSHR5613]KGX07684.1 hypothetical protein Y036_2058 [Burkholderia pseudomallei]
MENRPPRCVVIAYDEDDQSLIICTLFRDSLASRIEKALTMPYPLKDVNFRLDDEAARQVGGVAFSLLAVHQPDLKQYIHVTSHPDAAGGPPGSKRQVSKRIRVAESHDDTVFGTSDMFEGWHVTGSSTDVSRARLTLRLASGDQQQRTQIHFNGVGRYLTGDFMARNTIASLSSLTDFDADEYRHARASLDRAFPWGSGSHPKAMAVLRTIPEAQFLIEFDAVEIEPISRF